ncbi:DUF4383 domain-containing protein [Streptomyces sparsus]
MSHSAPVSPRRSPVALAALVVGVVFLVVGVLGFIPGVTTDMDGITFAGHESEAKLLGVFQVSILHNLVHFAFGLAGVAMSRTPSSSRAYLLGGGVIYLVLWLYGLLIDKGSDANFVPLNTADDWLHLALGVGMVALGFVLPRRTRAAA